MKPILVPGKKYTPWKVHFPGGKRRFFKTEADATQAIKDFAKETYAYTLDWVVEWLTARLNSHANRKTA